MNVVLEVCHSNGIKCGQRKREYLKKNLVPFAREIFNRSATKDSYARNITHNTESTAV